MSFGEGLSLSFWWKRSMSLTESQKALVLLSGGLDSAVNLYWAKREFKEVMALTFLYGQRAEACELRSSEKLCRHLGVDHQTMDLRFISRFGGSSLTDKSKKIPQASDVQLHDPEISKKTAQSVWVPNRNGIFLNVAAGLAESLGVLTIIPGFNREEAQTFPDNSSEFIEACNRGLSFSTKGPVQVFCFTTNLDKPEIAKKGHELGVPFADLWPCYFDGPSWCGLCESCQRFSRAVEINQRQGF